MGKLDKIDIFGSSHFSVMTILGKKLDEFSIPIDDRPIEILALKSAKSTI